MAAVERWAIEGSSCTPREFLEVAEVPQPSLFRARAQDGSEAFGPNAAAAADALAVVLGRRHAAIVSPAKLAAEDVERLATEGATLTLPLDVVRALRDACNLALGEG